MSDLSTKFTDLETQLAGQSATIGAYIDTVEAKLQAIADTLDILNENGAQNTKYILAALGQSAACFPCPTPSIVVPPIGTVPIPINNDHCKRAQAFIATMHNIFAAMDTMQSFNVIGTYNVVNDAISEVIAGVAAGDTVPLPSFPETVNIVGDYVSYAGERLFSGVGLIEQFNPLESDLVNAIYLATDASTARDAYNSSIDASGASNGAKLLFEASAYSALFSYFFDPGTAPDLSVYDGSVCGAPSDCITLLEDVAFTITKTCDNGNDWHLYEIPAWALRLEWEVVFDDGFNVIWGSGLPDECGAVPGVLGVQGFSGVASNAWEKAPGGTTYWGVGAFFSGLANGTTRNVTINYLRACPNIAE